MAGSGLDVLSVKKLNGIMQELRDVRDIPQNLRFLERTASRPATDGEIKGRFRGDILISDIIMEGATATIKNADRFTTETNKIPKIKHGVLIDEEMIVLLRRINSYGGIPNDQGILSAYVQRKEDAILLGIRQRLNALVVACKLDAFSYSRGGVVITGVAWGTPAGLKTTPLVLWSSTSATPITDISTQKQYDLETYGEVRDRITMSSQAFRYMIATDEFKAKAQLYSQIAFPVGSFPLLAELGPMKKLMSAIIEMEIELEDSRYFDQLPNGAIVSAPFLPPNKVIMDWSGYDNTEQGIWIGNAIVPETEISSLADIGGVEGQFEGPEYGPVSYSVASYGMNPPDVTIWGVQKAWPIKERLSANSVMTVY